MQHSIPHPAQRYRQYPNASGSVPTSGQQFHHQLQYPPGMSHLLSSAEENNIFGFLDAFDWDLDESVGAGMPAYDSGPAAGPEIMDVDFFNCKYNFIPSLLIVNLAGFQPNNHPFRHLSTHSTPFNRPPHRRHLCH